MTQVEDLKRKMARQIASAPGADIALMAYVQCWWAIPEYKFVFGAAKGAIPGFAVNRSFSGGARIRSLFPDERVLVLDPETIKSIRSVAATYSVDYSISLDSNAFSYLRHHVIGETKRLPNDFVEVFNFIARDDVRVDGMPYVLENRGGTNLQDERKALHVFESIKAYEVLRTIDGEWLRNHGEVRSKLDDAALVKRAQEAMSRLYFSADDHNGMRGLRARVSYSYANLLQLVLIQLQRKNWPTDRKVEAYIEFCHSRLATIDARGMVLAREYFERGQNLKFFGRIQAGRDDLLELLNNMAWDLFHVRQLESAMSMRPDSEARYFFPALLTYDQGLIEVMDLCPLISIAFTSNESDTIPIYRVDGDKVISSDPTQLAAVKAKYFSEAAADDRSDRLHSTWMALPGTIVDLENQLVAFGSKGH